MSGPGLSWIRRRSGDVESSAAVANKSLLGGGTSSFGHRRFILILLILSCFKDYCKRN